MKYDDLRTLAFNGQTSISGRDVFASADPGDNKKKTVRGNLVVDDQRKTLTFTTVDKTLDGGTGVWIPYVAKANVFGFLKAGHTWAASGPYSGCLFEIGECGGRIYAAHLSRESPIDENIASWGRCKELAGKRVLVTKKVGVYAPGSQFLLTGTAAITVASINQTALSVSVTRLDLIVANVGSMSGRIMNVTRLVSD